MIDFSDFEKEVLQQLSERPQGMTYLQIESFIADAQITLYRKVLQCYSELDTRINSLEFTELHKRRLIIELKKLNKKLEECTDELDKELIQIDIIEKQKAIYDTDKLLRNIKYELNVFRTLLNKYIPNKQELQKYIKEDLVEERKYWIARMGKQAAMDLLSFGKISVGNMDAITNMSQEDQLASLTTALSYATALQLDVNKIAEIHSPALSNSGVSKLLDQLPGTDQ
jgi:hypothetical protein